MDLLFDEFNNHKYKILTTLAVFSSALILLQRKKSGVKTFKSSQNLINKNIIITGANCGIGYETALDLATRGALVILACRDIDKANLAANSIRKITPNANLIVEKIDLNSLDSVKEFSLRVRKKYERIDILINNAGISNVDFKKTIDGFESQFQVNYLSHYLLTRLLFDNLIQSQPSKIINVSSKLYETAKINFDDINMENPGSYEPFKAYGQSKLCNILFSNYLVKYLKTCDINKVGVYSVSPGFVLTQLGRYTFEKFNILKKSLVVLFYPLIWYMMRTPNQGAQTTIFCAVEKDIDDGFYRDCVKNDLKPHAIDSQAETKLWNLSEKLVQKWLD